MQGATVRRSYLNTGVALVGASVIAVAPLAPAPPHVSLPTVRQAEVALAAAVNPIEAYLGLINNTVGNLSSLGQTLLANPAPILQQILKNNFATATDLLAVLQSSGSQLVNGIVTTVPQQLQEALANLAAGNIVGVGQNVVNLITQPVLLPFLTLLSGVQPLIEKPIANLLAVTQQFTTIVALSGIGVLEPVVSTINATAQAIQNVVDAGLSLNPVGLVSSIVAAPAIVVNGFLNGFGFDGGVLSPGLGLVGALLSIRDTIAQALGAPAPMAATAKVAAVSEPPAAAAKTVTLSTTSGASDATSKADATAKSGSGTATSGKDAGSAAAGDSTDSSAATGSGSSAETKDSRATESKSDTDTTSKGDTTSKTDTTGKGDTTAKDDTSGAKGTDTGSASAAKGDSTSKSSDAKKDSSEKSGTAKADNK